MLLVVALLMIGYGLFTVRAQAKDPVWKGKGFLEGSVGMQKHPDDPYGLDGFRGGGHLIGRFVLLLGAVLLIVAVGDLIS